MNIYDFLIPFAAWLISQIFKIIIDIYKEKKIKLYFLRRSWWFPSVHSSLTSALTTRIWLKYWISWPEFAIVLTFSFLIWYDAMNIRYEAWKHARALKNISTQIKNILVLEWELNFKERLGHTFFEVISGIILGIIISSSLYFIIY